MPVNPTYPGVYIEEVPSGVRTITGVATSITAFIGRARRGPVNEPVTINSFGDFERTFGGLWADSSLGFAVRDFYLNGGSQAVVVRLFHPTPPLFLSDDDRAKALIGANAVADAAKTVPYGVAAKWSSQAAYDSVEPVRKAAARTVNDAIQALVLGTAVLADVTTAANTKVTAAEADTQSGATAVADAAKAEASVADAKSAAQTAYDSIHAAEAVAKAAARTVNDAVQALLGTAVFADVTTAADTAVTAAEAEAQSGATAVADAAKAEASVADAKLAAQTAYDSIPSAEAVAKAAARTVNDAVQALLGTPVPGDVTTAVDMKVTAAEAEAQSGATAVADAAKAEASVADAKSAAQTAYDSIHPAEAVKKVAAEAVNDAIQALLGTAALADVAFVANKAVTDACAEAQSEVNAVADAAKAPTYGAVSKLASQAAYDSILPAYALKKAAANTVNEAVKLLADTATLADVTAAADAAVDAAVPPLPKATVTLSNLTLVAANEGAWGNKLRVRVDYDRPRDLPESFKPYGLGLTDLFNLRVCDTGTGVVEQFRNVTIKNSHRMVDLVLTNESLLMQVKGALPQTLPTAHDDPTAGEDIWGKDALSTPVKSGNEGCDGQALSASDDFQPGGYQANKVGLYALEKVDLFNILCIPPYSSTGDVEVALVGDAAAYCEKRRAMLLVDPPSSWLSKDKAETDFNNATDCVGTRSKNAALYFPRLSEPNPLHDDQFEDFALCGAVAGIFARTDTQRGVWKAPAGLDATLNGVPALTVPLTDAENGELNQLGINCLRALPAVGRVVWGARTLQGDDRMASEWKYIPVRRTALFIEESLYRGTKWVVFEPNDEPLWAQIRLNIGSFMHGLFRQGAFQGTNPKDAYFVKCDKETTTQNDINLGIVNILVGFAPLKPAEFVIIQIQQMAGQIQV